MKQGLHFSKKQRTIINTIISCIVLQKVRKQDKNTRAGMRVLKQDRNSYNGLYERCTSQKLVQELTLEKVVMSTLVLAFGL